MCALLFSVGGFAQENKTRGKEKTINQKINCINKRHMRTFIKIVLTFVLLMLGAILSTFIREGGGRTSFITMIVSLAVLGIWMYKPKGKDKTDLDKTM